MPDQTAPLFSIVIPFHNNRLIAPVCLPTVVRLRQEERRVGEIIAVDDCSTDGTADWIRSNHPEINLIKNERNLGFGKTCWNGIASAKHEWIILLNSDVKIESAIIPPLLEDIERHPDLFAVGFHSFNESGGNFEGRKMFIAKTGLFKTRNNFSTAYSEGKLYDTFYACGGHCLLSREKFISLHGFSPVFEPFYWEDADLSYRAMKRGWPVYFDPRCRVVHCHRGSISSANRARYIKVIQTRNKMLFFWKNVSLSRLWAYHAAGILFRLFTSWVAGDFIFYSALLGALKKVREVLQERSIERKTWTRDDRSLFRIGRTEN